VTEIEGYNRYALFWAPPAGSALARFGATWLGWDCVAGADVERPQVALPRPLPEMTRAPWRYGFHATLKPPFRLAKGTTATALDRAVAVLAAPLHPARGPGLAVTARLGFAALMLAGPAPEIDALAAACVTGLDSFRAPPSETELARRRATGLTPRQDANLLRWGYPYVLHDFRFHLTLSGRLKPGEAEPFLAAVTPLAQPLLDPELLIDEICLFGDPGENRGFRLLRRYPLTGRSAAE
jgi:putative phosphonate metabolism protein